MSSTVEDLVSRVLAEATGKGGDQSALCGQTLAKIFKNILDNPSEPKYRKLNKSNKALAERLFSINGVEELLLVVGWQRDGESLSFPVEAPLDSMRAAASVLDCGCVLPILSDSDLANQMLAGRREKDDWFARVFGFKEWTNINFMKTRSVFTYDAKSGVLRSKACRGREFVAGVFSTPSLEELRARVDLDSARKWSGTGLRVVEDLIDVGQAHSADENRGALFQAASQFNCLEHSRPTGKAEDGLTCYGNDRTQGPACALACPAGAVVRNYFAFDNTHCQTVDKQVNNLKDVEALLGNEGERFFKIRSGYTLATESSLTHLKELLEKDDQLQEQVRKKVRIGIQAGTEVLTSGHGRIVRQGEPGQHLVTQAYCSAVSVAYSGCRASSWEGFARIVLEAAYEATLLAGIEKALLEPELPGARKVFLTSLGGGSFGNEHSWIESAMSKAFDKFKDISLEVHVVTYKKGPLFAALVT